MRFCLNFYTEEKGFTGKYLNDFKDVLEFTKESKINGLLIVREEEEDLIIWSSPGGFISQYVYTQDCKTTKETSEKLKTYQKNKDTIIVDLINKYCC